MKKILILTCISLLTITNIFAQDWVTNFDDAKKIAQNENKKIIMSFQGSDWCAPCIKLDRDYFGSDKFIKYAKDHFVMLKVDFPKRKKNRLSKEQQKYNNTLADKYNKQGYLPLVVVFDKNDKILGKTSYNAKLSVDEFIKKLETL